MSETEQIAHVMVGEVTDWLFGAAAYYGSEVCGVITPTQIVGVAVEGLEVCGDRFPGEFRMRSADGGVFTVTVTREGDA